MGYIFQVAYSEALALNTTVDKYGERPEKGYMIR